MDKGLVLTEAEDGLETEVESPTYQMEVHEVEKYWGMLDWNWNWNLNRFCSIAEIAREGLGETMDEWVMMRENRDSKTLIEEARKAERETLMEEDKGDETNDWGRTRERMLEECEQ